MFEMDTLLYQGNSNDFINLVIMGDGFTASQIPSFNAQAIVFKDYFLGMKPFLYYNNYFNIFTIKVISAETGIKHPNTASDCTNLPISNPNNYFGTTFDFGGIHRLPVPLLEDKVAQVLADHFPDYDQAIIMANSPEYGGSGGPVSVTTLNSASKEISIHELGHSFGQLADEYWSGIQFAHECANMTADNNPATIRWKPWLTSGTGIGINQFTGFNWFKPTNNTCKMQLLNVPFCAVCEEAIIERIHSLVLPIRTFSPDASALVQLTNSQTFKLDLIKPIPNTLKTFWRLNSQPFALNQDSVKLVSGLLNSGVYTLQVDVTDTTAQVRTPSHGSVHFQSILWTISNTNTGIQIQKAEGQKMELLVFPNPGREEVSIQYTATQFENPSLFLYSADGKLLKQAEMKTRGENANSTAFKTRDLPAGIYRFDVVNGPFRHSVNWVKE